MLAEDRGLPLHACDYYVSEFSESVRIIAFDKSLEVTGNIMKTRRDVIHARDVHVNAIKR